MQSSERPPKAMTEFTASPKRFRVWDKHEQCWAKDADGLLWTKDGSVYRGNVKTMKMEFVGFGESRYVRVASTGEQDRNGNNVYEGHILVEHFSGKPLDWSTWLVQYAEGSFGRTPLNPEDHAEEDRRHHPFGANWRSSRFAITGHIFETKPSSAPSDREVEMDYEHRQHLP